jgi:hypothetical protein
MAKLSLEDLQRRINLRDSELQQLRQALEARQNELAALNQRKQELETNLRQVDAEIATLVAGKRPPAIVPQAPPITLGREPIAPTESTHLSLPALLVEIVRQASGPMTVKQLADEAKRRGAQSASSKFPRVVQTRVYALVQKSVLKRAADHSGFVLGRSAPKQAREGRRSAAASGRMPSSKTEKPASTAKAPTQGSLKQMLEQVLARSKEPLTGSQLADLVLKAGYRTTSKRFKDVVWVILSQMKNVENVRGQGYRLKKRKA